MIAVDHHPITRSFGRGGQGKRPFLASGAGAIYLVLAVMPSRSIEEQVRQNIAASLDMYSTYSVDMNTLIMDGKVVGD